jgi:uncharacterized membrane protein
MDFLEMLWAYIVVFLLAALPFFEAIAIIPISIIAGLSTVPVVIIALIGNLLTVYLVILFIEKIKAWRSRKNEGKTKEPSKRSMRAQKIWIKYGLPGLVIVGPFFVGSHLTAFMSLLLGGTRKGVTLWITISLVIWCTAVAVFTHLGVDVFQ